MPFGGTTVGIVAFAGIKVLGYSAAGLYLNRKEGLTHPQPLVFGFTRAAIGIAVGTSYAYALSRWAVGSSEFAFYPGLVPIRLGEWLLVLWLFYRHWPAYSNKRLAYAGRGIAWSFLLDVPAVIAAFTIPGGFWIC